MKNENAERFLDALAKFINAAGELSAAFEKYEPAEAGQIEGYPFNQSFDELYHQLIGYHEKAQDFVRQENKIVPEDDLAVVKEVVKLLEGYGVKCWLEYPGYVAVELDPTHQGAFGDINDTWNGDLNELVGDCWEPADHTPGYFLTDIPSSSKDAAAIAGTIREIVQTYRECPDLR